jgi:hypothetical protein
MAKACTTRACGRRLTTSAASVETPARCRWRRPLSLARSASQDENWCGRRVAAGSRADGRRAGRQPLGSGWPVRRRLTRRPRRGSRAAPARQPVVRRTMPTSSRFASATPRSSDRRMVAREGGDGGFRSPGAGICRRLLGGGVDRGQPGPSRRSSVVHLASTSRERGRGGEHGALSSPHRLSATMGVARGGGVAVQRGVRSLRRGPRSAQPRVVADRPAAPPGGRAPSPGSSTAPRSPSCHQVGSLLPKNGDSLGQ